LVIEMGIMDEREIREFMRCVWWKLMPGVTATVKWPVTDCRSVVDSDPNTNYRPYLEKHVGKQGWDWDWRIGSVDGNTLTIKFRKGKEKWATIIMIMWT
jgi:hypothetical protein